ncbi:MAG: CBS domain-containing protein [Candidatus Pristimantibacillus lignocellulolyticus]|uniref:CBS domain-containing protein n=1 Tax=Candidatus Pristimantibacillus lignocellulolyticus TaxID=2994561 RepID=A0A9J6Z9C5_9BACL|nr:MAG: CBS domain-containing protein [Candidatus Pristimantibacillus lignocellulolyticus]
MKKVKDLMTADCKTVTLKDNIYEIAVIMSENNIGFVAVVDEHDHSKLIGCVTDRDLVIRGYAAKHPGSTEVQTVMSENLITVAPDQDAEEAANLMAQHKIRRLPVIESGKLVGIIALGDLALAHPTEHNAGIALQEISENSEEQQYLQ